MDFERTEPCFAVGDDGVGAAPMQQLHLRDTNPASCSKFQSKWPSFAPSIGQRVALLALAQRSFAHFDAPELVNQRHDRGGTEQHEHQRARGDVPGLVAPVPKRGALVAGNDDHQRELPNMRHADETRLLIHGVKYKSGRV